MTHVNNTEDLVSIFKLLGHPIRLSIVLTLMREDHLNVGEIVEELDIPQATVSQQLAKLKAGDIVSSKRDGTRVHYRLTSDAVRKLLDRRRVH